MEKEFIDLANSRFNPTSSTSQNKTDSGGWLMFSVRNLIEAKATGVRKETSYPRIGLF